MAKEYEINCFILYSCVLCVKRRIFNKICYCFGLTIAILQRDSRNIVVILYLKTVFLSNKKKHSMNSFWKHVLIDIRLAESEIFCTLDAPIGKQLNNSDTKRCTSTERMGKKMQISVDKLLATYRQYALWLSENRQKILYDRMEPSRDITNSPYDAEKFLLHLSLQVASLNCSISNYVQCESPGKYPNR